MSNNLTYDWTYAIPDDMVFNYGGVMTFDRIQKLWGFSPVDQYMIDEYGFDAVNDNRKGQKP